MITIALPITLLLACGGGGGSGGGSSGPTVETLPAAPIADIEEARGRSAGIAPPSMTQAAIVTAIQTRATGADTWYFTGARPTGVAGTTATVTAPTCVNGSCSLDLPNVNDDLAFSLSDIEDLSLIDDTDLGRFNSQSQAVMVADANIDIIMIQSRTAALESDGTRLTFQTYGGWTDNTVFGVEKIGITEDGTTDTRLAAFSFGDATGTNPTGAGRAVWTGRFVGYDVENDYLVQGRANVDIDDLASPSVDVDILGLSLEEIPNTSTAFSEVWHDMTLTDGAFTDSDGEVRGVFYGSEHSQVGGVIDNGELLGSFGAIRQ